MKKLLIIVLLAQINVKMNAQAGFSSTTSEGQIIKDLTSFYTLYITENAKNQPNEKLLSSIKNKYCSEKLLQKLSLEELDYDPFLNAQDCDIEWLKTLSVIKESKSKNKYVVSFVDNFSKRKNKIKLLVTVIENKTKITSILK